MSEVNISDFQIETQKEKVNENIDWGLHLLGIPELWKQSKGEDIKIGIIDSGIDLSHQDLQKAVQSVKDFSGNNNLFDSTGHGTHIAGIIGARENKTGVIGVAPKSLLWIAKSWQKGTPSKIEDVCEALDWLIQEKVDIINMSLWIEKDNKTLRELVNKAEKENISVVAAVGNEGDTENAGGFPARYQSVISVGSLNHKGKVSKTSSRCPSIDIVAPGEKILSTIPPNTYGWMNGTSMAAAFVSGTIALLKAKNRKYSRKWRNEAARIKDRLQKCSIDLGRLGADQQSGFGLLNAKKFTEIIDEQEISINDQDLSEKGKRKLKQWQKYQIPPNQTTLKITWRF